MPHDSSLERLRRRGEIRIGFQRHTPPFSYETADGGWPIGYSVMLAKEVVLAIASHLGSPLRIHPVEVTSSTRTALLSSEAIDIECGSTTITEERKRFVAFSRPIFHTSHRIALKAGCSLSTTCPVRITGISGSTSHQVLLNGVSPECTLHFVGYPSIGEAFEAFLHDPHIDSIVADEVILAGLMRRAPLGGAMLVEERLGGESYGFMMRLEEQALHHAVNRALGVVLEASDFAHRYAPWFDSPLPGLGFSLGLDFSRQLEHLIPQVSAHGIGPGQTFFKGST